MSAQTNSAPKRQSLKDQASRDAAVYEKSKNVIIDAGAGTGKTSTLVARLVEQVAPKDGGPAVAMGRIAAVTFSRRAAGELKLRVREKLLSELANEKAGSERRARLTEALSALDTSYVGTIHSIADRLLRLRPVQAELSPSYVIAEDESLLFRETHELLLHAAETSRLADELGVSIDDAKEAEETILEALRGGVRAQSEDRGFYVLLGLDALFERFLLQRDHPPAPPKPAEFAREAFREAVTELATWVKGLDDDTDASRWLIRLSRRLSGLVDASPAEILSELVPELKKQWKKKEFGENANAYKAWKAFDGDETKKPVRATPLKDDLRRPVVRWMATRLVRLIPVVEQAYDKVKARHGVVDQLDLLLKLRDLVRDDLSSRAFYQSMFDRVFVDEFQDTDPLQAEVLLLLCEREPKAKSWRDAVLTDGKLTVVGDPKQSIYRFRRADVAMYEDVRQRLCSAPHVQAKLSVNFRSEPGLIQWFNARFAAVMGEAPQPGVTFDATTGRVFHQPLDAGVEGPGIDPKATKRVRMLVTKQKHDTVDPARECEGLAIAAYLKHLVEVERLAIKDPLTGQQRPVRYGDIAVLTISTFSLSYLTTALNAQGVPHSVRGGTLFLSDPLHQQFLLGLRALANRDDGIAESALLRPPFFALDLSDLFRARAQDVPKDVRVERVEAARARITELRKNRFERSPGAVARELLEETGFARAVALGPNGAQRLERLRELCFALDRLALEEGLDFDAVTARARDWVENPVPLEAPMPVAAEAVQVSTVHQVKGLEFPVVVLWDGRALWDARDQMPAWGVARDGRGWSLQLNGLSWEEPEGLGLSTTEKRYRDAERRRVVYVAATRARDLLVLPRPEVPKPTWVTSGLLDGSKPEHVEDVGPFEMGKGASWSKKLPKSRPAVPSAAKDEEAIASAWQMAAEKAAKPVLVPTSVSSVAHGAAEAEVEAVEAESQVEGGSEGEAERPAPVRRTSRFGPVFGAAVHEAIRWCVVQGLAPSDAVKRSAQRNGLLEYLQEAEADVQRAMAALRGEGLLRGRSEMELEYPVAGASGSEKLVTGYVDFLSVAEKVMTVIDFKTDAAPKGDVKASHPAYVAQVREYARLLEPAAGAMQVRCGLLFTEEGKVRWV